MSKVIIKLNNFIRGIVTSYGRGKEPEGSFLDSRNLLPTEKGSLIQAHGYSTTGGLATMPTGFVVPTAGSASTFALASIRNENFPFSMETPVAHDGNILFARDAQGSPVDHYVMKPWYVGTTEQTPNSGYVLLDEYKRFTGADATISGDPDHTIVVTSAASKGLSQTNDYYNTWRIAYEDADFPGQYEYAYVTDYGYSGDTATFTVLENVGTMGRDWTGATGISADIFTLTRWFHRPAQGEMLPTFGTIPGRCFESEGRIRGCGGASSSQHQFPWIAQYINRTFWDGHASEFTYQGTYVDEMECVQYGNTSTSLHVAIAAASNQYRDTDTQSQAFPDNYTYHVGWTLEYDGYQESRLGTFGSLGSTGAASDYDKAYYTLALSPSRMSKRVTAINIYVIEEIAGVKSDPMFIKRWDILAPTAAELDATHGWQWNDNSGQFEIVGSAHASRTTFFTYIDIVNSTGTYTQRTGRIPEIEADGTANSNRHIVAWEDVAQVSGRAFFGNYYDPNEAQTFVDQIRFTNISPVGIPNYDIIPAERDRFERDVSTGDPATVERLIEQNGHLLVFKTNGIYSTFIKPLPEEWETTTISLQDGIVSRNSLVRLPSGDIAFADVEHFKIIRNLNVLPITWNIDGTYYDLTNTAIVAWYDKIDRSLRFSDLVVEDSTKYGVWCAYLDYAQIDEGQKLRVPFYKLRINHSPTYAWAERNGDVLFSNGSLNYEWHKTDKTFAGSDIVPYLKTHAHVLDEGLHAAIDKVQLVRINTTGASGSLVNKLYVDSSSVTTTFATFSPGSSDKTNIWLKVRPTEKRMGRAIQFEYNTSAEINGTNNIELHAIEIYGKPVTPRGVNR